MPQSGRDQGHCVHVLQVINGPTGVAVSEEALLSHLVLQLLATIGHNNTLVWGKSDAFVQRIKQSAPGQLAGYSVMFDQEGSAPHFEDALRVNMQGMEVGAGNPTAVCIWPAMSRSSCCTTLLQPGCWHAAG